MRPGAVTVVAAFLFFATAMAAIVGLSLWFPNRLMDEMWKLNEPAAPLFQRAPRIFGSLLLLLSAGTAAAAIGLLRGRKWAWWFAVLLFALNGCGDLVSFILTGDAWRSLAGVAIAGAFLYALTRPEVRKDLAAPRGTLLV
ncbi:MAG TPA: hypothetical protein VGF59_00455 [Bryobacteraceae bacterium]